MTQQNNETKQSQPVKNVRTKLGYLPTYEENVFKGGREGITKGKFHDMFMAGDGHELEDYVDENGVFHLAHAKAIHSSSMLAYNFFHWVSPEHPFRWEEIEFDKVYFEVKFPIMTKPTEGRPVNRPANMDVVLISKGCKYMLCIESKYTEHTKPSNAEFADAYFDSSCYYAGNPYIASFIKMAKHYNGKNDGYYAGIKQAISHLIGLTNIRYDADALAWFKANNPFIEPEVLAKIDANTQTIFTNLLYYNIEMEDKIYDDKESYPSLLRELLNEHLKPNFDMTDEFESDLLCNFIETYPKLYKQIGLYLYHIYKDTFFDDSKPDLLKFVYYLNRYELYPMPHFQLPEWFDSADQYLTNIVMGGARKRYQGELSEEVIKRIKSELEVIHYRHWTDRFLIMMDYVRVAHEHGFCTSPSSYQIAGSVVCYALGITDIDPISVGLNANRLLNSPILHDFGIEFSSAGKKFIEDYLNEMYYDQMDEDDRYCEESILFETLFQKPIINYFVLDIVEQTIAATNDKIDFRTLPFDTPEQLQFFITDKKWRDYSYLSATKMQQLRAIEQPTFEDVVHIFSKHDGMYEMTPREHSYGICVLFMRTAWLKMHYPAQFQKAVNKIKEERVKKTIENATIWVSRDFSRDYKEAKKMIKATLERLTALQDADRVYIYEVARWHHKGLINLKKEEDLSKINTFLEKFLQSPIRDLYDEHFICKETDTEMPFDEMLKLVLIDAN